MGFYHGFFKVLTTAWENAPNPTRTNKRNRILYYNFQHILINIYYNLILFSNEFRNYYEQLWYFSIFDIKCNRKDWDIFQNVQNFEIKK